ncbi:unnamed protein product [Prunus armeniaca]
MDRLEYEATTSGNAGLFRRIKDGEELPYVPYKKTPTDISVLHIAHAFKQIYFFNDIPLEYGSPLFWGTNKKMTGAFLSTDNAMQGVDKPCKSRQYFSTPIEALYAPCV